MDFVCCVYVYVSFMYGNRKVVIRDKIQLAVYYDREGDVVVYVHVEIKTEEGGRHEREQNHSYIFFHM